MNNIETYEKTKKKHAVGIPNSRTNFNIHWMDTVKICKSRKIENRAVPKINSFLKPIQWSTLPVLQSYGSVLKWRYHQIIHFRIVVHFH